MMVAVAVAGAWRVNQLGFPPNKAFGDRERHNQPALGTSLFFESITEG